MPSAFWTMCGCPNCWRTGEAPEHFLADPILNPDGPPAESQAFFSTAQIAHQLRSSWAGFSEGTFRAWNQSTVTYAINDAVTGYNGEQAGLINMTALMQYRAREAFILWDDLVPLAFVESDSPFSNITFNLSSRTNNNLSYASPGSLTPLGGSNYAFNRGQIWLSSTYTSHDTDSDMVYGGYGFMTYIHEIGHSIGLSHPGSYNAGPGVSITYGANAEYAQDTLRYTVMSYFNASEDGSGTDHYGSDNLLKYAQTPMVHDVMAIQAIYGASTTTRAGDTNYGFNNTSGRDVFNFSINTNPIVTIFDSGGNDTLDLSAYTRGNRIDLAPGAYSDVGGFMTNNLGIAFSTLIENANGGSASDTIIGNYANNWLRGNGGNDTIIGNGGFDTAIFNGFMRNYTITELSANASSLRSRVSGSDGTDSLFGIHRLQFADGAVYLEEGNPLFDGLYYTQQNPDVFRATNTSPFAHYLSYGWNEGRNPSLYFNNNGYLSANIDVRNAHVNPLLHYDIHGWREGRDPGLNFDTAGYLAINTDVRAAGINPLMHFMDYGRFEGRATQKMVGSVDSFGFDRQFYLMKNPDVAAGGMDPSLHFNLFGWHEGRAASSYFDTAGYLSRYADVRSAGVNPLTHYSTSGWREGRDPSATFDTSAYRANYTDVANAGVNPLWHYMAFGINEGRAVFSDGVFD
ncbi:M10 family metallopeptidase C-terminal domain-containing protein [Humitalea sp. 24SJ18S-53]|uniref:M10 family metallopeptidase C-terminal domain-containing protein n=1 Tax=Humitalea sp. 24SJ18S-53 TaxID=3422307 RepID=UPI003D66DA0E